MFGIGMPELILILVVALIVFGPKKLPEIGKTLGQTIREFKKATNEFKESMGIDDELTGVKKAFNDMNDKAKDLISLDSEKKSETTSTSTDNAVEQKMEVHKAPSDGIKDTTVLNPSEIVLAQKEEKPQKE